MFQLEEGKFNFLFLCAVKNCNSLKEANRLMKNNGCKNNKTFD